MGLKRKGARSIKIIWVRTKSEPLSALSLCREMLSRYKIMEEEAGGKGNAISYGKSGVFYSGAVWKPVISIFITFTFLEG